MDNDQSIDTSSSPQTFEQAVENDAQKKIKNVKWEKLPKFNQWKLFKLYMHENSITDGKLFKKMRSLISERRTDPFVSYDVPTQKITNVDFKHENFIRERSKKKKIQAQLAASAEEAKVKELEAGLQGLDISPNLEVVTEDKISISSDEP